MSDLFVARSQIALSLAFHIVFAAIGIGLLLTALGLWSLWLLGCRGGPDDAARPGATERGRRSHSRRPRLGRPLGIPNARWRGQGRTDERGTGRCR